MRHEGAVRIGAGGMGEVFKAWDPDLERWVALKYLRHDDPELVERLQHEARAQARVIHPGVCRVYEVGSEDGRPFIAMEYVDGVPLDEAAVAMTLEEKVLAVRRVAEAVQAAHAAGLVHRDLKPGNILVARGEDGELRPYVLDFGIAREQEITGLTVTGQILGTPGYLSPEQARGETSSVDRRTDVWSLGVVLYELVAGCLPFPG
ncbi:MAG TPA: serine/threonine-protein kinase, partial [Thermoanaerobaculia bacterium]|nr:serine/threonine-protein kinase [Thermoanaerobaculia bacterium]